MNVGRAAFVSRTGPNIVDDGCAKAIRILEDTGADPIVMWKGGTWVRAGAAIDRFRAAMPVAKAIEVMDRHDLEGSRFEFSLPRLPVGNSAHRDGGEDRISKLPLAEQRRCLGH